MSCHEGSSFGVKRPLRFVSDALRLSETQHTKTAEILAALKTERAQAEVNRHRSTGMLSDAFASFDASQIDAALKHRAEGEAAVREAVRQALERLHGVFDAPQRATFAHLIRTGQLQI